MGLIKTTIKTVNPVKRIFISDGRQADAEAAMTELGIKHVEKVDMWKYQLGFNGGQKCIGSRYTLIVDPIRFAVFKTKMTPRNEGKPLEIL